MKINLIRATEKDAKLIHQMQVGSFCELYLKYRDETLEERKQVE